MSASLIRKISSKTVLGGVPEVPTKATPLYTVIGVATGVRTGASSYGEFTALKGQFEATNLATGEQVTAPQCFLPEPLNGMIAAQLAMVDDDGNPLAKTARFAVEVGVIPAKTATGYEYTARELVDTTENDPLADLRKALPAPAKKALPAPAKKADDKKDEKK